MVFKRGRTGRAAQRPALLFRSQPAIKGFRKSHKYRQRRKYHKHFFKYLLREVLASLALDYVQQEPAFNLFHGVYSPQRPTLFRNKWPPDMCRFQPDSTTFLPPVDRPRRGLFSCCLQREINGCSCALSFSLGFFLSFYI